MGGSTRFGILVYDEVEPIDVGATYGVLSMARRAFPQIDMFLVAERAGAVKLTNNLTVQAHYGYDDCPPVDIMVVTGGGGWKQQVKNAATLSFLRGLPASTIVASVCTGGMIVAAAGLLDGKKATTRRCGIPSETTPLELMGKSHSTIEPVDALIVDNGRVITGGGVSLAMDTMFYLLARVLGPAVADEVARLTEYTHARRANQSHLKSYICEPAPLAD